MNKTYLPNPVTGVYHYEGIAYLDGQFYRTIRGGNQFQYTYDASEEQLQIPKYQAEQLVAELPEDIKRLFEDTKDVPVAHLYRVIENIVFAGNPRGFTTDGETYVDASESSVGADVAWEFDLLQMLVETVMAMRQLSK